LVTNFLETTPMTQPQSDAPKPEAGSAALGLALRLAAGLGSAALVLAAGAWAGGALQPARAATGRPARGTTAAAKAYPSRSAQPPLSPQGVRPKDDLDGAEAAPEIPLGDALTVNGQPMQLSLFTTHDGPEQIIAFYDAAFRARGLLPVSSADVSLGHVSVFDPEDGLQRFISALPQADGETLVMSGITNPAKAPRFLRGAKGAPYPVPEEHRGFMGYTSDDAGTRAHSGQYVTKLPVEAVHAFYRAELGKDGWMESGDSAGAMLLFSKAGSTISVAVQALDAKAGAAVFVNKLEGVQK
jgi:hypothetical protein